MSAYSALQRATKDSTPRHQITGRFVGKVVDAYDGDTCRVAIPIATFSGEPKIEYLQVRMLGYDSPEMKKVKGLDHKPYGTEVKAVFNVLVLEKFVVIDIPVPDKPDPYGRILGHLYVAKRGDQVQVAREASCLATLLCCPTGPQTMTLTDGETSEPGTETVTVRNRDVDVPITADIPEGYSASDIDSLLHVNQWMIDNARVKAYNGEGARPVWTAAEIRDGV